MAHVLSISYDPDLLRTRELLLQQMGHRVTSAEGFAQAIRLFDDSAFDLIVMGHSIPHEDKRAMLRECRKHCSCPVLALLRSNEPPLEKADRSVDSSDAYAFITAIAGLLVDVNR
ncbi:MAG TPA: hypothetical protein VJU82_15470 [Acidobacteriaceae bacterium]|nr:hypothetical protein [Acidobacteriaceae bacterium]